jgi:hypothetical protein
VFASPNRLHHSWVLHLLRLVHLPPILPHPLAPAPTVLSTNSTKQHSIFFASRTAWPSNPAFTNTAGGSCSWSPLASQTPSPHSLHPFTHYPFCSPPLNDSTSTTAYSSQPCIYKHNRWELQLVVPGEPTPISGPLHSLTFLASTPLWSCFTCCPHSCTLKHCGSYRWELQLVAPGEPTPISGPRHQAILSAFEQYSQAVEDIAQDAVAAATAATAPASSATASATASAAAGAGDTAAESAVARCSLGQILRARFDTLMAGTGPGSAAAAGSTTTHKPQQQQQQQQHGEAGSVADVAAWLASDGSGALKQSFAEGWACRWVGLFMVLIGYVSSKCVCGSCCSCYFSCHKPVTSQKKVPPRVWQSLGAQEAAWRLIHHRSLGATGMCVCVA